MQVFMRFAGSLPRVRRTAPDGSDVRLAQSEDDQQLATVLTAAFGEDWSVDRVHRELLDAPDVVRTWVITSGTDVVGTASERADDRYPHDGYVHWVGVDPSVSGLGLGSLITEACLVGFTERGLSAAVLETDAFRQPAIRTYLRLGFLPEYRSEDERLNWVKAFQALMQSRTKEKSENV